MGIARRFANGNRLTSDGYCREDDSGITDMVGQQQYQPGIQAA